MKSYRLYNASDPVVMGLRGWEALVVTALSEQPRGSPHNGVRTSGRQDHQAGRVLSGL